MSRALQAEGSAAMDFLENKFSMERALSLAQNWFNE